MTLQGHSAAASEAPRQFSEVPAPLNNARHISEIIVRAVSVDQRIDDVGRELDEIAKRIP